MTIKYQVQEMLRIEKIFNKKEIQEEIDAYNPLIPDGTNLKATMLIMFPDVEVRREMLFKLHDIENKVWLSSGDKKIIAYGASARSSTILNYCNIGENYINIIADKS